MIASTIQVNRAPVLTLWAAVVAQRLGYDADAAATLGKAVAGLNAQAKGRRLGIFTPPHRAPGAGPSPKAGFGEEFWVELCGRAAPAVNTPAGVRAVVKAKPIDPAAVERYLESKFGAHLPAVRAALTDLANSYAPKDLAEAAYDLYEQFRPAIPPGVKGWGAEGALDLAKLRQLRPDA